MTDPDWMLDAACRGLSTDLFYVEVGATIEASVAKKVCARCRVREDCLEFALATREKHGIWGGANDKERRSIRRRRRYMERKEGAA